MRNFAKLLFARSDKDSFVPLAYLFAALGFIGFLDASYLTAVHYSGSSASCSIIKGCDTVLSSPYAQIGNMPVALVGVLYYLFIFFSALTYLSWRNDSALLFAAYVSFAGFAASLGLLFLQIFIIKAFCEYCLLSAVISTALMLVGLKTVRLWKTPVL